ncbi:hypothetical protein GCM10009608_87670 [Pseudonocardia alaniniphila]
MPSSIGPVTRASSLAFAATAERTESGEFATIREGGLGTRTELDLRLRVEGSAACDDPGFERAKDHRGGLVEAVA